MRNLKQVILIVNLLFISGVNGFSQLDQKNHILSFEYGKIEGIILSQDYFMPIAEDVKSRFTPSKDEILEAESIIKKNIRKLNANRMNQFGNCPVIHRHLNDYFRQYVGIINSNGEKVIHVNLLWNRFTLWNRIKGYADPRVGYKDGYAFVNDGCSFYWSVNVNLKTNKLFSLSVNSLG